jgi:hypothetical protein
MKIFGGIVLIALASGCGFIIWLCISFAHAEQVPIGYGGIFIFISLAIALASLVGAAYLFASAYFDSKAKK